MVCLDARDQPSSRRAYLPPSMGAGLDGGERGAQIKKEGTWFERTCICGGSKGSACSCASRICCW